MGKKLCTNLGQQEAEQEIQADQVHKLNKWRCHKNFRAEVWQASIKFQRCSLRPPFLIRIPLLLPNEWHFIWYATDSVLWSLFNMSLQILIDIAVMGCFQLDHSILCEELYLYP